MAAGYVDPRNDIFRFDPASMTWTELSASGPVPTARHKFHMAFVGGLLYVSGGKSEDSSQLNDLFAFDPATLAWTNLTNTISRARPLSSCQGVGMVALEERLYITCGGSASVFHAFDPSDMAWTDLGGAVRGSVPNTPITAGSGGLIYAFLEGARLLGL